MGDHDVYICYDEEDQLVADAVCSAMEDNDLKCWLKSRDGSINLEVEEIVEAIKQSGVFVLIFSEYSKHSNYVNTETDVSFSEKKPIITFKIDESKLDSGLQFFINERLVIDAYKDTESKFDVLVKDAFKALDRPVSQPVVSDKTKELEKKVVKLVNRRRSAGKAKSAVGIFSRLKIPIIAIVIILVVGVGAFALMNHGDDDDGVGGTSEAQKDLPNITMKIATFKVNDARKANTAWNYSYYVSGTFNPPPNAGEGYSIVVDFYDESGSLVNSTETSFDNAQLINNGYLFGSTGSNTKNIKRADAQLVNNKSIVVAHVESSL
jgi:hypothetical protein